MLTQGMFACPVCRRCETCYDEIEYAKKSVSFASASKQLQYLQTKSLWVCVKFIYWFMCAHSLRHGMCLKAEGSDYSGNVAWFLMCIAEEYSDTVICQMKANSTRHILEIGWDRYMFPSINSRHSFFRALTPGRASPQRRRGVAESWEVVFRTGWWLAEVWKDFKSTSYQNLFFLGVILLLLDPLKD